MGQNDEQTTMGSGGPRRTATRSAPAHPGSRRVRERIEPPAEMKSDDGQGGGSGGQDDEGSETP